MYVRFHPAVRGLRVRYNSCTWKITVFGLAPVWAVVSAMYLSAVSANPSVPFPRPYLHEPIQPIPMQPAYSDLEEKKIQLGAGLFVDPRLSSNNQTSCAHCHVLSRGGADISALSIKSNGEPTAVNTPTAFNLVLNFRLFWDGRFTSLEAHILQPTLTDSAISWTEALAKFENDRLLSASFAAIYHDGMTIANIQDALVAFERSLVVLNSPFDRFLRGDTSAISPRALEGYELFKSYGCAACHQGANVGGNMYQKLGIMGDYFADRGSITHADLGRYNVTGKDEDRHVFRVPSLRLVVLTAPYLHDGHAKTLREAIDVMAKYQLGRVIPAQDVDRIIEFLETLPGEYEGRPLYPYPHLTESPRL